MSMNSKLTKSKSVLRKIGQQFKATREGKQVEEEEEGLPERSKGSHCRYSMEQDQ